METIKSKRDFEKVFTQGRRKGSKLVRVTRLDVDEGASGRVAFVCARRLGNAVWRNRSKRVLREAARRCGLPFSGMDVILFATKATHDAHPDEVAAALRGILHGA